MERAGVRHLPNYTHKSCKGIRNVCHTLMTNSLLGYGTSSNTLWARCQKLISREPQHVAAPMPNYLDEINNARFIDGWGKRHGYIWERKVFLYYLVSAWIHLATILRWHYCGHLSKLETLPVAELHGGQPGRWPPQPKKKTPTTH